ncbi:MAG: tol-pal system protein YbgF [Syntrophobacteraceae bacterium]|jgi:tol-pal system protein YbgF
MLGGIENRFLRYCVVVFFAGLLAGCASTSETTTIQENLSILNQRQSAIEARLQNTEGASRKSGDLYSRIEELQTQMRTLNGRIEQLEHKLDQLQRAQASAAQAPAPQPSVPPSGTVVMEESPPSAQPPSRQQQQAAVPSAPPAVVTSPRTDVPAPHPEVQGKNAEQTGFERGVHLMQQKKYEAARKEFQGFISEFPKSDLEESALYDIGECYFLEKHYEEAIKAYQQVVDKYPKGGKTASALLKQATGWQQMGETTMARIIYTRLVEKFPGTAQAQAAEKKLQQM